jgi:hypothetical protein
MILLQVEIKNICEAIYYYWNGDWCYFWATDIIELYEKNYQEFKECVYKSIYRHFHIYEDQTFSDEEFAEIYNELKIQAEEYLKAKKFEKKKNKSEKKKKI